MKTFTLLGLLLGISGCAALYLGSPHQRWRMRAWRAGAARLAGALALAASGVSFMQDMHALTALLVLMTLAMLSLAAFPYLGVLVQLRRDRQHDTRR